MKNKLPSLIMTLISAIIVAFSCLYAMFVRNFSDHVEALSAAVPTVAVYVAAGLLYILCLTMLLMSFKIPMSMKNDTVLSYEMASLLKKLSVLMLIAAVMLFAVSVFMFCVGDHLISPIIAIVDIIAFAIYLVLSVLGGYIRRAAELKEEADATL